ncbi:heavy-metal-associated domain-containing protein [Rhodoglobus aureus]|jgi:copper chaperone CopZ|uniref:HMA domain-containing protein n=1 Tax=Rhodoglobus aureus TaxID=191497 RepID=A0ABN1VWX8_9MICO
MIDSNKNLLSPSENSCSCCSTDAQAPSKTAAQAPAGETATYQVAGMTCAHCASSVTEELVKLPGVSDVHVDVDSGRVTVTSQTPLAAESFATAVEEAGYTVAPA